MAETRKESTVKAETGRWVVVELVSSDDINTRHAEAPQVNYHTAQSLNPYEYASYLVTLNID